MDMLASRPGPQIAQRGVSGFVAALIIAVLIAAACLAHAGWMLQNHDADWMFIAARRMVMGGHYVRDFNEVTPPMILIVLAPAAAVANLTAYPGYPVFLAYMGLLIAISLLLLRPTLRALLGANPRADLVLVLTAIILTFEPGYEFGQREHVFLVLFLPGLLWYLARDPGQRLSPHQWTCLILAAAAVMIKPYYLLVPAVLLGLRFIETRSWRVVLETPSIVFAAAAALYLAVVLLIFPEYLTEARMQENIYFAWNRWWVTVLEFGRDSVAALCLAAAIAWLTPFLAPVGRVLRRLCVTSLCCVVVVLWQRKGWPYHYLPALEIAAFALAVAIPALWDRRAGGRPVIAAIALLAAFLALRPLQEAIGTTQARYASHPLIRGLHDRAAGQTVMLLTSGMQMGFPSLAGVEVGASHPGQVLLAGVAQLEQGDAAARARAAPLRETGIAMAVADIQRFKPRFIAVDLRAARQGMPDHYDLFGHYMASPTFREVWAGYRLDAHFEGWDLYRRAEGG